MIIKIIKDTLFLVMSFIKTVLCHILKRPPHNLIIKFLLPTQYTIVLTSTGNKAESKDKSVKISRELF